MVTPELNNTIIFFSKFERAMQALRFGTCIYFCDVKDCNVNTDKHVKIKYRGDQSKTPQADVGMQNTNGIWWVSRFPAGRYVL